MLKVFKAQPGGVPGTPDMLGWGARNLLAPKAGVSGVPGKVRDPGEH